MLLTTLDKHLSVFLEMYPIDKIQLPPNYFAPASVLERNW